MELVVQWSSNSLTLSALNLATLLMYVLLPCIWQGTKLTYSHVRRRLVAYLASVFQMNFSLFLIVSNVYHVVQSASV
jgi:hypothetical protein